jgi:hypothetical protein
MRADTCNAPDAGTFRRGTLAAAFPTVRGENSGGQALTRLPAGFFCPGPLLLAPDVRTHFPLSCV